jgi:excisionase family DNA binding protein
MKDDVLISDKNPGINQETSSSSVSNGTLLKVEEVARILRLKPDTIRAMARRGDLPAIKLGRVWRFRRSSITQLLEE